jgi:hypothetical protein
MVREGEEWPRLTIEASRREASVLLKRAADALAGRATIKQRIGTMAHALGWAYSRTRDIWHGEARRIDAHEMDQLRWFCDRLPQDRLISTAIPSEDSDAD